MLKTIAVAMLAMPWVAYAASTVPEGHWQGVLNASDGKRVRVAVTSEADTLSLRFDEPARCAIVASLLDEGDTTADYRFRVSRNGGAFCAKLYPGELHIRRDAEGRAVVRFYRATVDWTGTLEPAGDS